MRCRASGSLPRKASRRPRWPRNARRRRPAPAARAPGRPASISLLDQVGVHGGSADVRCGCARLTMAAHHTAPARHDRCPSARPAPNRPARRRQPDRQRPPRDRDRDAGAAGPRRPASDGDFAAACRLLLACRGRVVCTGMGKSGHIATQDRRDPGLHRHAGVLRAPGRSQPRRPGHDHRRRRGAGAVQLRRDRRNPDHRPGAQAPGQCR